MSDAITIRDNGTDRNEIAVRGFYSDNPPTPCMDRLGPIVIDPLQMTCFDEYVWLLDYPERLPVVESRSGVAPQPAGPGLHPYLGRLGQRWTTDEVTPSQGVDVVMVGHFDDPARGLLSQVLEAGLSRPVRRRPGVVGRSDRAARVDLGALTRRPLTRPSVVGAS